jgi:hypothetical protein
LKIEKFIKCIVEVLSENISNEIQNKKEKLKNEFMKQVAKMSLEKMFLLDDI